MRLRPPLAVLGILFAARILAAGDAPAPKVVHTDDYQRSARLDTYRVIADSGAGRGENIYFYKCWMCHNQYAKTGPYLKELYKHSQLMSGDPVTDENVTAKIKAGGPGMPSFGTTNTLTASSTSGDSACIVSQVLSHPWHPRGTAPPRNSSA